MNKKNAIKASKILFENRLNRNKIKNFPNECIPKNLNEGYYIQNELMKLYLNLNNNKIIGRKVGCTNNEAQLQLNIKNPFCGYLFSNFMNISGCELNSKEFTEPYFEPEFSFKINQDINISKAPYKFDEVKKFISSVIPSVEIVDFRFKGNIKEIGALNLIASNAASEYWIKGKKEYKLNSINLFDQEVEVYVNNKLLHTGNSSNVLKNPINSLVWVINFLAKNNQAILENNIISTGTCTPAIKLNKNDNIKIDFKNIEIIKFKYN